MTHAQPKPNPQTELDSEELPPIDAKNPPSWFARTYGEKSAGDMADRYLNNRPAPQPPQPVLAENAAAYEAYRQRLEERFAAARRQVDPQFIPQDNYQPAPAFPTRPVYMHGMVGQPQVAAAPKKPSAYRPVTLAVLAIAACGMGGGLGYLGANPDRAGQLLASSVALVKGLWATPVQAVTETVVNKKTVLTARLEVNDAVGAVNSPIPLDITAIPADAQTPVALRISGLPPSAYLTKGVEIAEGEWMLKAADIAKAELIVPHTETSALALQVHALEEKTGVPASPSQDWKVKLDTAAVPVPGVPQPKTAVTQALVVPASAVPDQGFNKVELPAAIPVPLETLDPEAQNLISKGERLLKDGDVLAARQFFLRAYGMKATSAAYGVGQTFDPAVYAKYNIKGLSPNPQQAAEWYGKAAAAGNDQASAALAELPAQP